MLNQFKIFSTSGNKKTKTIKTPVIRNKIMKLVETKIKVNKLMTSELTKNILEQPDTLNPRTND